MSSDLLELLEAIETSADRGPLRELAQELTVSLRDEDSEPLLAFQAKAFDKLVRASAFAKAYLEALSDVAEAEVWRRDWVAEAEEREALFARTDAQQVLLTLAGGRRMTHGELFERLDGVVRNETALSRLLKELAESGWVRVVPDADGRRRPRALTALGQERAAQIRTSLVEVTPEPEPVQVVRQPEVSQLDSCQPTTPRAVTWSSYQTQRGADTGFGQRNWG